MLEKLGLQGAAAILGEVNLQENISVAQLSQIRHALAQSGFELLEGKKDILVQQIKTHIIQLVYFVEEPLVHNLSNLFSEKLGTTIEKFFICHKIERVKELLGCAELSLTDIAFKMHYSSVAHLSSQFKKVSGMTPSEFKQREGAKRNLLENLCK